MIVEVNDSTEVAGSPASVMRTIEGNAVKEVTVFYLNRMGGRKRTVSHIAYRLLPNLRVRVNYKSAVDKDTRTCRLDELSEDIQRLFLMEGMTYA